MASSPALVKYLIRKGIWSDKEEKVFREEIRKAILNEFSSAEKRQKPAISELFTDVYDELPWNLIEQQEQLGKILKDHPENYPLAQHVISESISSGNHK